MIKYLGSKRVLVPRIVAAVRALGPARSVFDAFSGTARVGHALKRAGYQVIANDHLAYAATLARCYVEADARAVAAPAARLLRELATVPPAPGYFTETYCERSRYFRPANGARIDAIREAIARMRLEPALEAVLLTSLMEAADRVDSTTGVQMAYLKRWAPRAYNDLELRIPDVLPGAGLALHEDALAAARRVEADVAYLDPPYNQHRYLGNYHIWETLVRWDRPAVYGTAHKRADCRDYDTPFNSKRRIRDAFAALVASLRCRHVIVSFSDEGFVTRDEILRILGEWGRVAVAEVDFRRYVGARIGIYSPNGVKVGKVGRLRNTEYLFVASRSRAAAERGAAAARAGERRQLELI